jgi:putative DNA primase/helicase
VSAPVLPCPGGPGPADPEGLGREFRAWEDALGSDADMTTAVKDEALRGCCWAGGSLGWRRYDDQLGTWPAVPEEDIIERVRRWMLKTRVYCMTKARDEAAGGRSTDYWDGLAAGWKKAATASKITAVTKLARGACYVSPSEFDTHPDLANAPNGVIDLRTGVLHPHSPALLLTQVTGAAYVPGARHPDIDKALEAIPADIRAYAQLRYGQAATGWKPPDDVIDVQHGGGENGKTTVLAAMSSALGDYAQVLPTKLLFISPEAHSTELMTLRGVRLGIIEELPEEHQLSVAAIKIASAGTITARLVHKDNVTFENACSLVVSTNYRPQIRETDHGTWRRLEGSIPYPFTFRKPHEAIRDQCDRPGDPTLRERVKADKGERAEAMLAWLVAGAMAWYAGERAGGGSGRWLREPMTMGQPPQRVRDDVREWRESCDLLFRYMGEHLAWDRGAHVIAEELMEDFNGWITGRGHRPWSAELFTARWDKHSEVRDHHVVKIRPRAGKEAGLSRPAGAGWKAVPGRYQAWAGVGFQVSEDDGKIDVNAAQTTVGSGWSGPKQSSSREALHREVSAGPDPPDQRSSENRDEPGAERAMWERLYRLGGDK